MSIIRYTKPLLQIKLRLSQGGNVSEKLAITGMQRVQQKYLQDPNYREIDNLAIQLLQQLPYKQAVQIQEAR